MLTALVVSNLLLWLSVIALGALVLALLRQVGVLHERVAPAGALVGSGPLEVGQPAPRIEAVDWNREDVLVGGPKDDEGSTLLLFVSPSCPVCKTILPIARSAVAAERGVRLILASDGPRDEHDAFVQRHELWRDHYILSAELGVAYGIAKLPYGVLIDAAGIVRARGLVNTREHLESLFEAHRRGVGTIQDLLAAQRVA